MNGAATPRPSALLELPDAAFLHRWSSMEIEERSDVPEPTRSKCFARFRALRPDIQASVERAKRKLAEAQPQVADATAPPLDCVELIRADTIAPVSVDWLWPGFLATGKVHIIAGAPGTGENNARYWATGYAHQWREVAGWKPRHPRIGTHLVGEDSLADTLVPRLIASGADLSRIRFVGERRTGDGSRYFDPAVDFEALEREAARIPDLRFVIVDPIVSAIAGDSHKNGEVRRGLQPLVRFADRSGCAIVGISHYSKGTAGRDPVERVTGSIAFGALARLIFGTAKVSDEDGGGRILVRAKSNIGPDGGGFKYDLKQVDIEGGIIATRPEWLGTLEGEARELLATAEVPADADRAETQGAVEWLRAQLADGELTKLEVFRRAAEAGFPDRTVHRARQRLGAEAVVSGFGKDKRSVWKLSIRATEAHSCQSRHKNLLA